MKKSLARVGAVFGGAAAVCAVFGAGSAAAEDYTAYNGMTYNEAANAIASSGKTAVIGSKIGSFLPTSNCIVKGAHTTGFPNSSGSISGSVVLLNLNCNYKFALPGVPGNSHASPEGKAAYDEAVAAAQQQAEEAQAAQEAADQQAAAEAAAGG